MMWRGGGVDDWDGVSASDVVGMVMMVVPRGCTGLGVSASIAWQRSNEKVVMVNDASGDFTVI